MKQKHAITEPSPMMKEEKAKPVTTEAAAS
jgi:hypothetical protein